MLPRARVRLFATTTNETLCKFELASFPLIHDPCVRPNRFLDTAQVDYVPSSNLTFWQYNIKSYYTYYNYVVLCNVKRFRDKFDNDVDASGSPARKSTIIMTHQKHMSSDI